MHVELNVRSTMTATQPDPAVGYIRGGAGVPTEIRHVLQVLLAVCLAALAILTLALTVKAAHESSRNHRLSSDGVAVQVTVTRCLGIASGTGITVTSFTCHGSFALNGRHYNDVIGGNTRLHAPGTRLAAVVDPGSPATLATAQSVTEPPSATRAYLYAAIPAVALVLLAAIASRRTRRPHSRGQAVAVS
jgi:MYXO-CTERM domain-containing protein